MSSTNKTTNYELSQYIGSDKPTYLGDYNADMLKIDTAMKNNADNIQTVGATASTASNTANQAIEDAEDAQDTADGAQETANSALGKAVENEADIAELNSKFNINTFNTYGYNQMSRISGSGSINNGSTIKIASNSDGSVCKIYGRIIVTNVTASGKVALTSNLRPDTDIEVDGICLRSINGNTDNIVKITIKTDGTIEFPFIYGNSGDTCFLLCFACLVFLKDFGDATA